MSPLAALRERLALLAATPASGRTLALLLAAVLALAAAAALVIAAPDQSKPEKRAAPPSPRAQIIEPPAPSLTSQDLAAAKRVAREFLPGYLAPSYGRRARLRHASPELVRDLRNLRPKVPSRYRSRTPRISRHMTTEGSTPERVLARAFVEDEAAAYTVQLELKKTPSGRYAVVAVSL